MLMRRFIPAADFLWITAVRNTGKLLHLTAAKGWRFAGFVPSKFTSNGGIKEIDLVFEREV